MTPPEDKAPDMPSEIKQLLNQAFSRVGAVRVFLVGTEQQKYDPKLKEALDYIDKAITITERTPILKRRDTSHLIHDHAIYYELGFKDAECQALTRTPEAAPDGGEDIRQLDNYFNITSDLIGNGCEHGFKPAKDCPNKDCDKAKAHKAWEALTRPPLDLAGLKAEIDPWVSTTIPERTFFPKTDVARWIELYLDHLQAIRPDIFGGK